MKLPVVISTLATFSREEKEAESFVAEVRPDLFVGLDMVVKILDAFDEDVECLSADILFVELVVLFFLHVRDDGVDILGGEIADMLDEHFAFAFLSNPFVNIERHFAHIHFSQGEYIKFYSQCDGRKVFFVVAVLKVAGVGHLGI